MRSATFGAARIIAVLGLLAMAAGSAGCGLPAPIDLDAADAGADGSDPGDDTGRRDRPAGDGQGEDATDQDRADLPPVDAAPPSDVGATPDAPAAPDLPPPNSCDEIALTDTPEVPLILGQFEPAGTGGPLTIGRWVLTQAMLDLSGPFALEGTGHGVVEITPDDALNGRLRLRLMADLRQPVNGTFDESGIGPYVVSEGNSLQITPICTNRAPFDTAQYTVENDNLTLWATFFVLGVQVQFTGTFHKQ